MNNVLILLLIGCAGCGNQAETPSKKSEAVSRSLKTDGYIWEREKRPYQITRFDQENACPIGGVRRSASIVYPNPPSRAEFEKAVREVYSELRSEIERKCPTAKYKRINIRFYFDKREDPEGQFVCQAISGAADKLPKWPPTELYWKWRDKSSTPSPRDRNIYFDYMKRLGAADKKVWQPYKGRAITPAEIRENERLYNKLKHAARRELCRDWKITEEQLDRIWWHNHFWLQGMKVTTKMLDDAVRKDH